MNTKLFFDFVVNKQNKTIHVKREFNAGLELVWKAWTTAEILDQWWGPKPCQVKTKTMDFRSGGHWLYAMIVPNEGIFWSKVNYLSVKHHVSFTAKDGFCDENGIMAPDSPQNLWEGNFCAKQDRVEVDLLYTFDSLDDLEQTIKMNFKEGFTIGLQQLDELLEILKIKNL